jgi:hypothetical protein
MAGSHANPRRLLSCMNDGVAPGFGGDRSAYFSRKPLVGTRSKRIWEDSVERASEVKSFVEILMKIRARASGEIGAGVTLFS